MSASPWLAGFRRAAQAFADCPWILTNGRTFAVLYTCVDGRRDPFSEGYRAGMRSALGR